jgi:hypothetical protein
MAVDAGGLFLKRLLFIGERALLAVHLKTESLPSLFRHQSTAFIIGQPFSPPSNRSASLSAQTYTSPSLLITLSHPCCTMTPNDGPMSPSVSEVVDAASLLSIPGESAPQATPQVPPADAPATGTITTEDVDMAPVAPLAATPGGHHDSITTAPGAPAAKLAISASPVPTTGRQPVPFLSVVPGPATLSSAPFSLEHQMYSLQSQWASLCQEHVADIRAEQYDLAATLKSHMDGVTAARESVTRLLQDPRPILSHKKAALARKVDRLSRRVS